MFFSTDFFKEKSSKNVLMPECNIHKLKPPTRILQVTIYETFKVFHISLYIGLYSQIQIHHLLKVTSGTTCPYILLSKKKLIIIFKTLLRERGIISVLKFNLHIGL